MRRFQKVLYSAAENSIIETTILEIREVISFALSLQDDKWKMPSSAYGVPPGQFFNLANLNATEVI